MFADAVANRRCIVRPTAGSITTTAPVPSRMADVVPVGERRRPVRNVRGTPGKTPRRRIGKDSATRSRGECDRAAKRTESPFFRKPDRSSIKGTGTDTAGFRRVSGRRPTSFGPWRTIPHPALMLPAGRAIFPVDDSTGSRRFWLVAESGIRSARAVASILTMTGSVFRSSGRTGMRRRVARRSGSTWRRCRCASRASGVVPAHPRRCGTACVRIASGAASCPGPAGRAMAGHPDEPGPSAADRSG